MTSQKEPDRVNAVHATLVPSTDVEISCVGYFASSQQSIAALELQSIALYSIDQAGKVVLFHRQRFLSTIRRMATVPSTLAEEFDYLAVTSDSGFLDILQFHQDSKEWKKVSSVMIGKSGLKPAVAGEYLAVDPQSRCIMVGALERSRLLIPVKQGAPKNARVKSDEEIEEAELGVEKISLGSPLEAPKATVTIDIAPVDRDGEGHPVFAVLEAVASRRVLSKQVVFYELDEGLNSARSVWTTTVSTSANQLISLPAGDGPGGIIVCADSQLTWFAKDVPPVTTSIPYRESQKENGLLITSHSILKTKNVLFILVQSEHGDLYQVELQWKKHPITLSARYFDSTPPFKCFSLYRRGGYLMGWAESGPHVLYQLEQKGYSDDSYLVGHREVQHRLLTGETIRDFIKLFSPHPHLRHLKECHPLNHLGPVLSAGIQCSDGPTTITTLNGRSSGSRLVSMTVGKRIAANEPCRIPGMFERVLAAPLVDGVEEDLRIVLSRHSYPPKSLVLRLEGAGVAADIRSEFHLDSATVAISPLASNCGYIQVHSHAIRYIAPSGDWDEWKHSAQKPIFSAALNPFQILVAFERGEVKYFELDLVSRKPKEIGEYTPTDQQVTAVLLPPTTRGSYPQFCGILDRSSLEIRSLNKKDVLRPLPKAGMMKTEDVVLSAEFVRFSTGLSALLGTDKGAVYQVFCDDETGSLRGFHYFSLGRDPCRVISLPLAGFRECFFSVGTSLWHGSATDSGFLQLEPVEGGVDGLIDFTEYRGVDSSRMLAGILLYEQETFFIPFSVDPSEERFITTRHQLPVMGKRFFTHPRNPDMTLVLSVEHRAGKFEALRSEAASLARPNGVPAFRTPATANDTCSTLQMINTRSHSEENRRPLELAAEGRRLTALSTCIGTFPEFGAEPVVVVGVAENYTQNPVTHSGGLLIAYRFEGVPNSSDIQISSRPIHPTALERDIPTALHAMKGFLLVGTANPQNGIQVFQWGKTQFLLKDKIALFESPIVRIQSKESSIIVADSTFSVYFLRYRSKGGSFGYSDSDSFSLLADDSVPRRVTAVTFLDNDTVAVGDKFGSISILRLPMELSSMESGRNDDAWKTAVGQGTLRLPKLKQLNTFHVGDVVTDLFCALKETNGNPMLFLLYTTIRGAIGVISPLTSDAQFIQLHHLQTIIRGSCAPTVGVEHHLFRSRYYSTSTLIDADFIGQFKTLPSRDRQLVHDKVMRELKVTNDMFEKRGMKRREFAESCDDMLLDIQALLSALLGVPQPVS